ncbi:MAG: YpdA family putative bacillithiol disulfide reductase [Gemmatimonadaceae bacterium]|nr:YpdA family putative bacillithiol disulfide reductase [Gemmatimonadaceae bacterium]
MPKPLPAAPRIIPERRMPRALPPRDVDVVVVGAGPCGLSAAIAVQETGHSVRVYDRGCIVAGIASYPVDMAFFSSADRISIGGVPFAIPGPKPTRREALAYYRTVADHHRLVVRTFEPVEHVEQLDDWAWRVHSRAPDGEPRVIDSAAVVVATGYFGRPNRLGVPGDTLPHVTHRFIEGHVGWDNDVVVVGGGNSAVDAALELQRAGARVTIVHFGDDIDDGVKPWVKPEIQGRLRRGDIRARFGARITRIHPAHVDLDDGGPAVRATQVYLMTGYQPECGLLEQAGVGIDRDSGVPDHDPRTMETTRPGLFMAGVLASGYAANRTFIETGRFHGDLIAVRIAEVLGAERRRRRA